MPSLDRTSNFLSEKTARDARESRDQHAEEDEDGHVSVTQIRVPCPSLTHVGHQVDHLIPCREQSCNFRAKLRLIIK